ncbi:MAG: pyruvate kinase [Phycisphaerales bacterium JB037]
MSAAARVDAGRPPAMAKIVATIGPASESPEMIAKLIEAGVNVFRFNFSHGNWDEHERRLDAVRRTADSMGRCVACLGDLPGPKIRVGVVPGAGIELHQGQDVEFHAEFGDARVIDGPEGPIAQFGTTYPEITRDVEPGQRVLVNDGAIRLLAVSVDPGVVRCRVVVGGLVTSGKGINLPESAVSAPALTERDLAGVEWAVKHGMDYLALSFVRSASEIRELQTRLWTVCSVNRDQADSGGGSSMIPVIAKIEKPQALANIESIVEAADGIMVARGDLGVEMDIAQVPMAQKRIVEACRRHAKPCIVATQMLETMIENATPTRAEATDVANAIFDGAGAVMLSGETAVGKHPALVVETMRRIVTTAESEMLATGRMMGPPECIAESHTMTAALARAAAHAARSIGAAALACWSQNGGTALYLSQQGLGLPILAYSSDVRATRRMALLSGVFPISIMPPASGLLRDWGEIADRDARERGFAPEGSWLVLVAGKPLGHAKRTNTLTLHRVGDESTGFAQQ